MSIPTSFYWRWLENEAIDRFKRWRVRIGVTPASAASYATGARKFVHYCRSIDSDPSEAIDSFRGHLAQRSDLSDSARSDYQSHARAFVRFLHDSHSSEWGTLQYPTAAGSRSMDAPVNVAGSTSNEGSVTTAGAADGTSGDEVDEPHWFGALDNASNAELLAGYARTLEVLRSRNVLRTANAPVGDFAEWLVWRAFGGTIEPNSTKSHDVTDTEGRKLQVKARLVSQRPSPGQLQASVFRSWTFDFAVLVQLAQRDYRVVRASMIPVHLFDGGRKNARWTEHVKGWTVFMTPALMGNPVATDVTALLQTAAKED